MKKNEWIVKKANLGIIEIGWRKCMKATYFLKPEEDWIGELKISQNQIMIHSGVLDNKFYQNWDGKLLVNTGKVRP